MWEIILAAGVPIWPIILASLIAVTIIIERAWTLHTSRVLPPGLLAEVQRGLSKGTDGRVLARTLNSSSPLGRVFASALTNTQSRELAKESVEETGRAVAHELEKYLSTLGTIATVSPLLGLLGTVIGMVELFGAFTASGHDVVQFARGISVALYNTAAGIIVAVPAMIAYRYFRAKVDNLLVEMEQQAIHLVDIVINNQL